MRGQFNDYEEKDLIKYLAKLNHGGSFAGGKLEK
ncbi:hypothetical protein EMIT0P100_80148 [Pseudomonas sp. IT-P100]